MGNKEAGEQSTPDPTIFSPQEQQFGIRYDEAVRAQKNFGFTLEEGQRLSFTKWEVEQGILKK